MRHRRSESWSTCDGLKEARLFTPEEPLDADGGADGAPIESLTEDPTVDVRLLFASLQIACARLREEQLHVVTGHARASVAGHELFGRRGRVKVVDHPGRREEHWKGRGKGHERIASRASPRGPFFAIPSFPL